MKIIGKKTIYKGKYLKVVEKEYLTKTGKKGIWECVEKKGGVFIFPLTKNKEVILEKIYRVPLNSFTIEIPAGLLDKSKEKPEKAAKRELLEETGYLAKKLIPVFKFPVEPGLASNQGILFFAPDVEFVGKIKGEDVEEIEVLRIPLKKLEDFLIKQSNKTKVDLKIFGALAILKKRKLI
jgi:ADP-ribose pyrophosphatase